MSTGPAPEPLLTFPPFPPVAEGNTLVPFKDFKPSGIQIFSGDGEVELDGLGIPTIELRVKHDTDEQKTGTKKGKKKKKVVQAVDGEPVRRLTWWEEWEEGEDLRVSSSGYSLAISRADRLFKASQDFTDGRRWPGLNTGVREFWDRYRLYLGLLVHPTIYRKPTTETANTNKRAHDELDKNDDIDDEDDEDEDDADGETKKVESEEYREERLIAFLNDPEKATQIFLSSYMREHGLIWYDRNLIIAPRLTAFFLNFLLRNRVLPESNHERGLKRALEITAVAQKELPLTAKIGHALPDDLSSGLKDCFGKMSGGSYLLHGVALKEWGKWVKDEKGECKEEEEEREKKRLKVDEEEVKETETETETEKEKEQENENGKEEDMAEPDMEEGERKEKTDDFEEELKAAIIHTDHLPNLQKEIIDDNVGMDVDLDIGSGPGWDCPDDAWGADGESWGQDADAAAAAASDPSGWGGPCLSQDNPWEMASKTSLLMQLLGPTTLPLTHTTGIVEKSTRRIKTVIPPPAVPAKSVAGAGEGEDPEGVEEELEKLFAKVVLEPWVGEEDSDIRRPVIRTSSKGAVIPGSLMEDGTTVEGDEPAPEAKSTSHNPLESEITLLVEPATAELMTPGMGMLATWIQIVRQEEKKKTEGASGAKHKKKKKGKKTPKGYWYMEELLVTFVSFYTQEKLIQVA